MKKNKGENTIINNVIKLIIIIICSILQFITFILLYGATSTLMNYATIIFELIKFITIIYIIYKNQDSNYKMIWIILIMFLPVIGLLTYIIWGNTKISKKNKNKTLSETKKIKKYFPEITPIQEIKNEYRKSEAIYLNNVSQFPIYNNSTTTYFETGEKCYEKLIKDLKNAQKYILIEFFIISDGKMWQEIYQILKEKSEQKVDIYIIYDSLGSLFKKPKKLNEQLEKINVKYLQFNPLTPFIRSYINYRDHRKIVVIDGCIAYTGGINIGDEYININSRLGYWKDCGIRITDNPVTSFVIIFFKQWNLFNEKHVDYQKFINKTKENISNGYIIPYSDGPENKENPSENTYINIINHAKKYIYIMTPYLILDSQMQQALINSSQSGIEIKIITPYIPDKKLVNACTKSFYEPLLNAGIKIYEYKPGFIHSKVIVSDDEVANVGTVNFDFRSFYLNYECGIWMYKTTTEIKIKEDFLKSLEQCKEIKINNLKKRPLKRKIIEAILRLISPLL